MSQEIVVPRMGESISEAHIGTILKPSGSTVKVDDEILELETDKVNQVVYAPTAGTVNLSVKSGDAVKIGQVIGTIEALAKQTESPKETAKEPTAPPKEAAPTAPSRQSKETFLKQFKREELPKESPNEPPQEKKISPEPSKDSQPRETRKKLPKIRQVIADKLLQAQNSAVMLTTFNEVDMTQVLMLRERYKENFLKEFNVKLGLMSFFVHASVLALRAFPEVNAYLEGDELILRNYYDIGVAVSTDRGLMVPVLRNCDLLNYAEIEQALEKYAQSARQGTIQVDDLKGGGFTITNGGVFGSLLSTPILNPPQAAILGMHKIVKRPVAIDDQVVIRPMMYLALTYDHRLIDGREAVSFLVHIKQSLEDPARQLLEI